MRDIPFRRRGCYIERDGGGYFPDDRPGARPATPPGQGGGAAPGVGFAGFAAPLSDFQAVRDQRRTMPLYYTVDLSTARSIAAGTAQRLDLQGNSFYADPVQDSAGLNIAGYAVVHFQDQSLSPQGTPFTVGPQFIAKVPFTQLLIENYAQAGKVLRIAYGVDIDFSPGLNASVTIGGTVLTREQGEVYGASYQSTTAKAANTPDQVFAPGSNVNGATIWRAEFYSSNNASAEIFASYLAKASAPANVIDGDVIVTSSHAIWAGGTANKHGGRLERPVFIAAGKGFYFISTPLEGAALRQVLYTLH